MKKFLMSVKSKRRIMYINECEIAFYAPDLIDAIQWKKFFAEKLGIDNSELFDFEVKEIDDV